jgi:outer membrane protein assembly factor BamB
LKNGLLYGLTGGNELFCLNTKDGKLAWSAPAGKAGEGQPGAGGAGGPGGQAGQTGQRPEGGPPGQGGPGGPRGRGGRGGGGGGYGNIVDVGSVLLALTPSSELIAFEPGDKAYKELARIKVSDSQTHAYPVVSGNRIFIKDKDSVTLWTVE